jgi:cell division protein FtsB
MIVFLLSGVLVLVPFIAQQTSEIGTMLVDEVKVMQQNIASEGIETVIQQSRLPSSAKNTFVKLLNQGNIKEQIQSTLMNNASQIASL